MTINERQHQPSALKLQAAARHFYRQAKWVQLLRVGVNSALAIAGPIVVLVEPTTLTSLGAAAGVWIFFSRLVLQPLEERFRIMGARAQEEFDTQVFEMPWNESLCHPIAQEEIEAAARSEKVHSQPWYPDTWRTDWPGNVLICQRSNAVWARRQHSLYAWILGVTATVWGLVGIGVAIFAGASLAAYLVTICLPSLPAFLDVVDHVRSHLTAAEDRRVLEESIDKHLRDATADGKELRQIQDRLYDLRARAPLVPEWLYSMVRPGYEADMRGAAGATDYEGWRQWP